MEKLSNRRKRRRQENQRLALGLCVRCGREPVVPLSRYGERCLDYWRDRARERKGSKPWSKGVGGRPPLARKVS